MQNKKLRESAFGNKYLILIIPGGRLSFCHPIPFFYGSSIGGYIK